MEENNKVLAIVGDKSISQEDVMKFISSMQGGQQFMNPQGIKQITDELVNQELLYIQAKNNKLDQEDEFVRELEFTKENMLKNYAMHKLFLDIEVSENEIKDYYDNNKEIIKSPVSYKASHILVENEKIANEILSEIKSGKSFEQAADEYSLDNNEKNGGDLGEFSQGTMVKEFEEALEKLSEGEISAPVKTQFGYHLIKLDHKHDSFLPDFNQVKERIKDTLLMIRRQEKYLSEVKNIGENIKVEKFY